MKLIRKNLEKDSSGTLTLCPEDPEDMWYIYNLVSKDDEVETKTFRKIVPVGRDGKPLGGGTRKLLKLKVKVEKIEFDARESILKLNGPVVDDVPDVSSGTYHTIDLELNRNFNLWKEDWDSYALHVVDEATNIENRSDIGAVVLQPGLAHICLVTDAMTILRAKVETNIPRKRRGDNSGHDKAMKKFLDLTYDTMLREIKIEQVKVIVLAAPGTLARELYDHILHRAVLEEKTWLVKSKSKFLVVNTSSGHLHALDEALASPQIQTELQDTRYGRETTVLNKFFKSLNEDNMKAWYGPKHVEAVIEKGAIETLMITDTLFRSDDIIERRDYVKMVDDVRAMGKEVLIFSGFHSSGEQLDSVTGVACLSLYPLPELEDLDSDED